MARIVLGTEGYNTLTHETVKNINTNNSRSRDNRSLRGQGIA